MGVLYHETPLPCTEVTPRTAVAEGICDQTITCRTKPTGETEHPAEDKTESYQRLAFTNTNLRLLPPTACATRTAHHGIGARTGRFTM